jgi:hypothetical protein
VGKPDFGFGRGGKGGGVDPWDMGSPGEAKPAKP